MHVDKSQMQIGREFLVLLSWRNPGPNGLQWREMKSDPVSHVFLIFIYALKGTLEMWIFVLYELHYVCLIL